MRRIPKLRKVKDTILILTNGKRTETNYFNSITESYKSMFKIKVEPKNKQCDALVDYAISLKTLNYNQIWCVFDIDDTLIEGHLMQAIKKAESNGINVAFSNESFEVWLLYHLSPQVKPNLTRRTYIKEINKLLQSNGCNTPYQKNDKDLLKTEFLPKLLEASENAKKIYQRYEADHQKQFHGLKNYPIWDWKSTSTVYRLIDSLQLTPKNDKNDEI